MLVGVGGSDGLVLLVGVGVAVVLVFLFLYHLYAAGSSCRARYLFVCLMAGGG